MTDPDRRVEQASGDLVGEGGSANRGELEGIRRWLWNGTPRDRVSRLLQRYPDQRSLELSWSEIAAWDPEIADRVVDHSEDMLEIVEEALRTIDAPVDVAPSNANVRLSGLPSAVTVEPGAYSPSDPPGDLLAVRGQIAQRTQTEARVVEAAFECQRCGTMTYIPQGTWGFQEPHACQGCEQSGPFRLIDGQSEWVDEQLAILESVESRASGGETASITVILRGDLCDAQPVRDCQQATVVGTIDKVGKEARPDRKLLANNVESDSVDYASADLSEYSLLFDRFADDPEAMYERCLNSVAPHFETGEDARDEQVQEALWLQLFGGSTFGDDETGAHYRGEFHVLLPGDPGVGKSVLLKWANAVSPKSEYHDGARTSGPGLSAAIVGDSLGDSDYVVAPGALVRGHRGMTVVDELTEAPDDALDKCRTALEDQVIPISMAGQQTTLPAQTALLAGCNPEGGHFDPSRSVPEQLDLASPVMSRFGLVLAMRSKEDRDRVEEVSSRMLKSWELAQRSHRGESLTESERERLHGPLSSEQLRAILMRGKRIHPTFASDAVREDLRRWYTEQRLALPERYESGMDGAEGYDGPPLPLTARSLSAARRIAEASARAHLRDEITHDDVQKAKELVSRSLADLDIPPVCSCGLGGVSSASDLGEIDGLEA